MVSVSVKFLDLFGGMESWGDCLISGQQVSWCFVVFFGYNLFIMFAELFGVLLFQYHGQ